MNFNIFQKVIYLPLSTTENSVACVLAYHVRKDGNSCFPSYETINEESGAANKTISKVIRTLKYAGVIDFKHRAKIGTNEKAGGKESNEYFFIFDDIGFYRRKLTKENLYLFRIRLKEAREKATADMIAESAKRKQKQSLMIPSQNDVPNTSQMLCNGKSQNVNNDVCNVAGKIMGAIPSHFSSNTSQMLRRSNTKNVQAIKTNNKDIAIESCKKENQKTVLHEKECNHISNIEHDSQIKTVAKESPSSQSNDEWLADYE